MASGTIGIGPESIFHQPATGQRSKFNGTNFEINYKQKWYQFWNKLQKIVRISCIAVLTVKWTLQPCQASTMTSVPLTNVPMHYSSYHHHCSRSHRRQCKCKVLFSDPAFQCTEPFCDTFFPQQRSRVISCKQQNLVYITDQNLSC
jgi:hypothetical protein